MVISTRKPPFLVALVFAFFCAACGDGLTPTSPAPLPPVLPALAPPPQGSGSGALVGEYTMTLTVGSTCSVVPEGERTRRYRASIETTGQGDHLVTLADAQFLTGTICTAAGGRFAGVGCNQFFATDDDDTVLFDLVNNNDEAHGAHIVERLPSGAWVEIIGSAVGRRSQPRIEAAGKASVWYCRTGGPFPCVSFSSCPQADLEMTFTR